jgi:hypothetical protein
MLTVPVTRSNCKAYRAYLEQTNNSVQRGIQFEFSFAEWQWVWLASGHFDERGRDPEQFCMARHGDTGPYKVGNVAIKTNRENFLEVVVPQSHRDKLRLLYTGSKKSAETRERMRAASLRRNAYACLPSRKKPVEVHGVRYDSVTDAAKALGLCQPTVTKRLKAQVDGYRWV